MDFIVFIYYIFSQYMTGGKNSMEKEALISAALSAGKKAVEWAKTDEGKKFICGTYTDGTTRSLRDAWNDEYLSPKTRKKRIKDMENRKRELERLLSGKPLKKKKKKKKKSKKKKSNQENNMWISYF